MRVLEKWNGNKNICIPQYNKDGYLHKTRTQVTSRDENNP